MEQQIRDWSLKGAVFFTFLSLQWAILLACSSIFNWSGISNQMQGLITAVGPISLMIVLMLGILNVISNLNIISKSVAYKYASGAQASAKHSGKKVFCIGLALTAAIIGAFWFSDLMVYRVRTQAVYDWLDGDDVAQHAVADLAKLAKEDAPEEKARKILGRLSGSAPYPQSSVSALFPAPDRKGSYVTIVGHAHYVGPGLDNDPVHMLTGDGVRYYSPSGTLEKKRFAELVAGQRDRFAVKENNWRKSLSVYRRYTVDGQDVILVVGTDSQYDTKMLSSNLVE